MKPTPLLCSVLIPSREAPEGLLRAVMSLYENCMNTDCFEVLVRLDSDDFASIAMIPLLVKIHPSLRVIVGDRKKGYESVGEFISEMAEISNGYWVTMIDDDVTLDGLHWDAELEKIPTYPITNFFVQPEFYWLGKSKYPAGSCGVVGWFVPNGSWKFHTRTLASPVDQTLFDILVKIAGWEVKLLPGICYNHQHWKKDPTNQKDYDKSP